MADTRLLLTLEFPPSEETRNKIEDLTRREIARHLFAPSIILTEFIKIAGPRMSEDAAKVRIRLLKDMGMRTVALGEEEALIAGSLLLSHQNVPIADALVASFVKSGLAEYVVTDDPHYKTLGIRTNWF
ncbi:MAG: PIN domain-containing protein [Nitrososphaerales archaeon]|nr:PIN domain-containing protein [Nitrososphaerales archaeon]